MFPYGSLDVVVSDEYYWWATMAVLNNRRYDRFSRLRMSQDLAEDGQSVLIGSSSILSDTELDMLASKLWFEIILWDGVRSYNELLDAFPHRLEVLENATYAVVGRNIALINESKRNYLLFQQDAPAYVRYESLLRKRMSIIDMTFWQRQKLLHRSKLVSLKHITKEPLRVARHGSEITFAGQSGRITLEGISPDPTPVVRELVAQVKILETEGSPVSMPVDRVLLDITRTPGLRGYELLLAAKAVTRIYVLSALVASDLKTHFVFYPQKSINIYQSSFLRRNIYLDFGGINGDELVYPRYADLLVRGKEPYRVAPPNHVASIPTDGAAVSLARDVRGIVDLVLTDLGARRSRLA